MAFGARATLTLPTVRPVITVSQSRNNRPGLIPRGQRSCHRPARWDCGSRWCDSQECVRPFPRVAGRGDRAPPSGTGRALSPGRRLMLGEQRDPVPHIAGWLGASNDRDHPVIRAIERESISIESRVYGLPVMSVTPNSTGHGVPFISMHTHRVSLSIHTRSAVFPRTTAAVSRTGNRSGPCLITSPPSRLGDHDSKEDPTDKRRNRLKYPDHA